MRWIATILLGPDVRVSIIQDCHDSGSRWLTGIAVEGTLEEVHSFAAEVHRNQIAHRDSLGLGSKTS